MLAPTSGITALARWIQQLTYNDIRRAESFQPYPVRDGKRHRMIRGVPLTPVLVLGRDRQFYRLIDTVAVVMPLHLVAEQFPLTQLIKGYEQAKKTQPPTKGWAKTRGRG